MNWKRLGAALSASLVVAVLGHGAVSSQTALGVPQVKPWVGALYPDTPIAQGHNDAAKALAMVDDNPLIRWAYRVWCVTGYHNITNVGTNQYADPLPDPKKDLVSPRGFYYREYKDPMPAGGVQFMDNAWYFGTDYVGAVVVRTSTGLLLFDAFTTAEDTQRQLLDQMPAAGLNAANITHIFVGHRHGDHTGGINLIRRRHAPKAIVVAGTPDAQWMAEERRGILAGTKKGQADQIPESVEIAVPAFPGVTTGAMKIDVGGGTQVVAIMGPGHTEGQLSVIVPVTRNGAPHKLLVFSGNDQLSAARQYAVTVDFTRGIAELEGADTFINTHPYQSAIFYHLRRLKADRNADNPLIMGTDGVSRFLGVFADCQRAAAQRFADGTWVSWQ